MGSRSYVSKLLRKAKSVNSESDACGLADANCLVFLYWMINKSQMRTFFKQRIINVVIVVAVLMLFEINMVIRARNESHKNSCINNLRLIDSCKKQWALEQRKKATDIPTVTEFWDQFWGGRPKSIDEAELPRCPNDPAQSFRTSYQIGSVGEPPICLIDPKNHVLPPQ